MVQFIPKVPIISKKTFKDGMPVARTEQELNNQQEYIRSIQPSSVGIATGIVYVIVFLYAYYTASRTGKITLTLTDHYGITLSEAFEHAERVGTTILLVVYAGLYIGLLVDKGFLVGDDPAKTSIVATNFALLLGMLLLFLIPVSRTNKIQAGVHFLIAALIIAFVVYSSFMLSELYRSELQENEYTQAILGLSSTSLISSIIVLGIIISKFAFSIYKGRIYKLMFTTVGILEIIIVVCYGIVTFLVGLMPPLINYETLECLGLKNN